MRRWTLVLLKGVHFNHFQMWSWRILSRGRRQVTGKPYIIFVIKITNKSSDNKFLYYKLADIAALQIDCTITLSIFFCKFDFLNIKFFPCLYVLQDVASASFQLAVSVVQNCGEKVERCICQLLKSCILNRDAVQSVIKESYHEIILEVYQTAPQLSLSVIPLLTEELLVRIPSLPIIR